MKLTKEQLRKIIKEELQTAIQENREEQLKTIPAKIVRLKKAIENAKRGIKNMEADAVDDMDLQDIRSDNAYQAKTEEILNLEDKIESLEAELEKLKGQSVNEVDIGPGDQTIQGLEPQHDESNRVDRMRQRAIELIKNMSPLELQELLKQINPET